MLVYLENVYKDIIYNIGKFLFEDMELEWNVYGGFLMIKEY